MRKWIAVLIPIVVIIGIALSYQPTEPEPKASPIPKEPEPKASPIPAPAGLTAIPISNNQILLSWLPPTETFKQSITGYLIEREIIEDVLYDEVTTVGSSTTTYTVSGLETEKTYSYVITANLAVGNTPRSNAASATLGEDSKSTPLECENDIGDCYKTTISRVIDGDTIKTQDTTSIRFSLTSAPELNENGGQEAKQFLEDACPVGSDIIIDEDDGQLQGSYGRVIAKVFCNGMNLNAEMVNNNHATIDKRFCKDSEFKDESWTDCA